MQFSSMQGIYALLTGEDLSPFYIYATGTEKGFRKEMMRFGLSRIFGILGVDAGGCADEP